MYNRDRRKGPGSIALFLDLLHIIIGAVIVVLAVISFLNPEDHMIMFPIIFLLGAVLNLIYGVYRVKEGGHNKKACRGGFAQILLGGILLAVSIVSVISIWG
ncbi:DUF6637 family protein [Lachnoclostridium edouardi]|uniref:DUF6637 family protein n=1 Tax=Lachnoclostridium edouardi TaxID=1926283 RepID=UPI000C7CD4EB|nr:DUF6637 family protein [Lachnoclostridium edouardi]